MHIIDCGNNFIGSADPAARCVISANDRRGVLIEGSMAISNHVRHCLIGTDRQGLGAYPNGSAGIHLRASAGPTDVGPGNVLSGNQGSGILCEGIGTHHQTIRGNFIGTDIYGGKAVPNGVHGIEFSGSPSNLVGGVTMADRNVISGNTRSGIFVGTADASGNTIRGNLIGTDAAGTAAIGNGEHGVHISEAPETSINHVSGVRNVISGNHESGIFVQGAVGQVTRISGSLIGTDINGTNPLGNVQNGILTEDASAVLIGGPGPGANVVAHNGWQGIHVKTGMRVQVRNTALFANGLLGVDLGEEGVTPNDAGDTDTGPNSLQNFPVLTSATYANGETRVQGTLNSAPNANFNVELFANDTCDPFGNGEGRYILGIKQVSTDVSGNAAFNFVFTNVLMQQYVTAIATDSQNNSSEFSRCIQVIGPTGPTLGFERSGHELTLFWPNEPSLGLALESTTNLNPPIVWGPVTNEVNVIGNTLSVTVETSVGNKFFRLSSE